MTTTQLSPKQKRAIAALIETGDTSKAADEASVSRQSIYNWLKEPAFVEALRTAEAESIRSISRRLVAVGDKAVSVIAEMMNDPKASASVRLRAADSILARLLQLREQAEIETRLQEIEARMEAINDVH